MVFTCEPDLATTTCDFVGWLGVRFGLLKPDTPARFSLGSIYFFFAALMLSTRFGYLRPAALAAAFADAFCADVKGLETFFGFGLSHTCFFFGINTYTLT
jgi:hypothetical protein